MERLQKQSETESKMLEKVDELDDEEEGTLGRQKLENKEYSTDGTAKRSSKRVGSLRRPGSHGDNMAVVPYLKQKPKNRMERKVFEDLDKIRRK